MKSIQEHMAALDKVERDISIFEAHKAELERDFVADHHPHKIGDVVEVLGYSFKGKKGRVNYTGIRNHWNGKKEFFVRAAVLRNDGTEGARDAAWSVSIPSPETATKP